MKNEIKVNQQLEQVLAHLGDYKMNKGVRNVPIAKGEKVTFTGESKIVKSDLTDNDGNKVEYGAFVTAEGYDISFTQIARRNNGLNLTANTIGEAVKEFASRIPKDGLAFIVDVKKVESSFGDGKQTYYCFKPVEE